MPSGIAVLNQLRSAEDTSDMLLHAATSSALLAG